ncbi:MAG: 2-succinyl-5-enolpyruvyl-6-hydroxy-3-cyclohexene-1-carboxylic-acid synthase [Rhabdochlamydiaceae bacterium]|nr:2-succinyl-5-enolpyruvyl-6-hydroxy-3-cyclohexene-1-carboxylic-acid synthase [Candidatus Amphrikana amoebophyrae]
MTKISGQQYSDLIITELVKAGVRSFCIAPGSRSSSLILSAANHPLANTYVHYDERGLGFFALGLAQAKKNAVAIIVTSGTALGNLYPAVMEAKMSDTPLIVITADRPFELQNCGANQTVDQMKFFGNYVSHFYNLPASAESENHIRTTIDYAAHNEGPVHINIMQRDPFLKHEPISATPSTSTHFIKGKVVLDDQSKQEISDLINEHPDGIITCGSCIPQEACESICDLAEKLNWPIIVDITSSIRSLQHDNIIPFSSLLFKQSHSELKPKMVLHFGNRFISKDLLQWKEQLAKKTTIIQVTHKLEKCDPSHRVTHKVCLPIQNFCSSILPYIEKKECKKMLDLLKDKSCQISTILHRLESEAPLNETFFFSQLSRILTDNQSLFLGNSLTIRAADHAFYPKRNTGPIFANRGCSGIDGNIATMAGICSGLEMPLVGIIGDQTFLHDINSLPLIKNLPIQLIIINNQGGRIFEHLPINEDKENCSKFLVNQALYPLECSGHLFNIPYSIAKTSDDFFDIFGAHTDKASIIELALCPTQSLASYQDLISQVQKSKKSKFSKVLNCYFV